MLLKEERMKEELRKNKLRYVKAGNNREIVENNINRSGDISE